MDRCCIYTFLAVKQNGMAQTDCKTRLYIDSPLSSGSTLVLLSSQVHYLLNVLRCRVSEATIAGNLADMYMQITAADDIDMRDSTAAPSLRIDSMMVAGS